MTKIVVTGTGRSGTGWAAAVLNSAGIFTGHERVFGPAQTVTGAPLDWAGYHADASWLAVPRLPLMGVRAALVVRHPLDVVASMAHIGFGIDPHINAFTDVATKHGMSPDLDGWLNFWVQWNAKAFDHVEAVFRFDRLLENPTTLTRWAGAKYEPHTHGVVNDRADWKTGDRPELSWDSFYDTALVEHARILWDALP